MATTVARLQAVLSANTKDFDRAMDQSQTRMGKATKAAGAVGLALGGVLAVGAVKAVKDASNLNEQINKTNVVFGKSGKNINKWATGLAKNFGLSTRAALESAGTFGNMLVPMGFARKRAADLSKNMVQLAGDMASFNNASPEDVLEAMRSGLAGEIEPLRKFGIFLSQDRIKAEALASGIVKSNVSLADLHMRQVAVRQSQADLTEAQSKYGKGSLEVATAQAHLEYAEQKLHLVLAGKVPTLTAAQKAQATYNIITKDTTAAQGDFARTSGSLANQQRILKAEMENVSAELGTKLLPIMTKLMGLVIRVIGYFAENKKQAKLLAGALVVLAAALTTAAAAQTAMNLAVLANPYVAATVAILALAAGVGLLYLKFKQLRPFIEFFLETIVGLPLPLRLLITLTGGLTNTVQSLWRAWQAVSQWIAKSYQNLTKFLDKLSDLKGPSGIDLVKKAVGDADPMTFQKIATGGTGPKSIDPGLYDELAGSRSFGLSLTSGYRPGARTKHGTRSDHSIYPSKAIDVAGPPNRMAGFFRWLIGQTDVKQAFYDPLGSIFGGVLSSYREGGHSDHVHVATYDRGGFLQPGWNLAYNGLGRPEPVGDMGPINLYVDGTKLFSWFRDAETRHNRRNR